DVAREYTEQWHHQQQIRDATHREPLYSPHFFAPVLDAFMRAMPHAYRNTAAADGAEVEVEITGEAGGRWFVRRNSANWELFVEAGKMPEAALSIPQEAAWRLFTKGMHPEQARSLATVRGDRSLADPFFETVAVLA
ncbi:MAG TPA: hypothetical protein VGR96_16815, partial [Acidobacteriaceae bacterium]|nr:hypothetical protein [Acidobacteriaceae bacterium]